MGRYEMPHLLCLSFSGSSSTMNYEIRFIITVLHALAAIRCFSVKFILNLYTVLLAVSSINCTVKRVSIKRSQSFSGESTVTPESPANGNMHRCLQNNADPSPRVLTRPGQNNPVRTP